MPRPDEILTLGVDLDAKAALQAMGKFQRQMKGEMAAVTKAVGQLGKINKKALQEAVDGSKEWLDELDEIAIAHDKESAQLAELGKQVDDLKKRRGRASAEDKKGINASIQVLEKQMGTMANRVSAKLINKASANKMRKGMADTFQGVADDAGSIFSSLFNKDLKGAAEAGSKGLGKLLGFGLKKGAAGAMRGGAALKGRGAAMAEAGAARGGMGGAAMGGLGKALGGLGSLMSKMGPLISTVAKLGPLLSTASTIILAIVKLFIDAEAQAKQFQKEVLQSASTTEFLYRNAGDVDQAFGHVEDTIHAIRNAAYDLKGNLDWGISAEQHTQVLNVLNQEGVSLYRIAEEAKNAKKDVGAFAAELTHVSVAYSRAFGVPMQEINQMQASMMTDLGMSLQQTRLAFGQMTRAASDSGIAANKFFGIIRGVSQDLSLYNTRMEDAVKTLKMLGKVMNPREAQKFMSTAMQGLKNMGRQERLRMTLLAGSGKMASLVNKDIQRKQKGIAETIAGTGKFTADEAAKTLASGNKAAINDMINKLPKEIQGSIREGVIDIDIQKTRGGKGVFGTSGAAANLGPAAALEAMRSALKGWGGGKSLREGAGSIGMEMMAENLGISQEQLDQMIKFEAAIDMERESLKKKLESGDKATVEKLNKAGMKTAKDIDKAGYDQIYDVMDEGQKKQLNRTEKVENFAKRQTELTSSLLDKLGVIIDYLMNQLYNILVDIWESILGIMAKLGIGDMDTGKLAALKRTRDLKHGKAEITKVIGQADPNKAIGETRLVASMNKVLGEADKLRASGLTMDKYDKEIADLEATKETGGGHFDPSQAWSKADQKHLDDLKREKAEKGKIFDAEDKMFRSMGEVFDAKEWGEALKMGGASDTAVTEFLRRAAADPKLTGSGILTGMEAEGQVSSEDINDAMRKLPTWSSATLSRKTIGLGNIADILGEGGFYSDEQKKTDSTTAESTSALADAGTKDGTLFTKFSSSFLKNEYKKTMETVLLDSLRTALFEYFMYSKMDPDEVAKYVGEQGLSGKDFAKKVGEEAIRGDAGDTKFTDRMGIGVSAEGEAPPNARGGLVTGVDGGLASVTAAAGEGLASVGPGERILPAGGGRGGGGVTIPINVTGVGANDLAQIIHAKVVDGIAEYKRRERFT